MQFDHLSVSNAQGPSICPSFNDFVFDDTRNHDRRILKNVRQQSGALVPQNGIVNQLSEVKHWRLARSLDFKFHCFTLTTHK